MSTASSKITKALTLKHSLSRSHQVIPLELTGNSPVKLGGRREQNSEKLDSSGYFEQWNKASPLTDLLESLERNRHKAIDRYCKRERCYIEQDNDRAEKPENCWCPGPDLNRHDLAIGRF